MHLFHTQQPSFDDIWIKCIPARHEDVDQQVVYMIIALRINDDNLIERIKVYARFVQQVGGGWISLPCFNTVDSHFFEMTLVPPEVRNELNHLLTNR